MKVMIVRSSGDIMVILKIVHMAMSTIMIMAIMMLPIALLYTPHRLGPPSVMTMIMRMVMTWLHAHVVSCRGCMVMS